MVRPPGAAVCAGLCHYVFWSSLCLRIVKVTEKLGSCTPHTHFPLVTRHTAEPAAVCLHLLPRFPQAAPNVCAPKPRPGDHSVTGLLGLAGLLLTLPSFEAHPTAGVRIHLLKWAPTHTVEIPMWEICLLPLEQLLTPETTHSTWLTWVSSSEKCQAWMRGFLRFFQTLTSSYVRKKGGKTH